MALQGTLDTFSLPDVLRLLATTGKTGRLRIEGDRGQGSVWLHDGKVVDAAADRAMDGTPPDEVAFELLRFESGSFAFDTDDRAADAGSPHEVEDLLRKANSLLSEWSELEAVVPSLAHQVTLSSDLSADEVTIDADHWRSVVAVASGRTVGEMASTLELTELGVSRAVRDLVELGVAEVGEPDLDAAPPRRPAPAADLPRRSAPAADVPQRAEPVPDLPRRGEPAADVPRRREPVPDLPRRPAAPTVADPTGPIVPDPLPLEGQRAGWLRAERTGEVPALGDGPGPTNGAGGHDDLPSRTTPPPAPTLPSRLGRGRDAGPDPLDGPPAPGLRGGDERPVRPGPGDERAVRPGPGDTGRTPLVGPGDPPGPAETGRTPLIRPGDADRAPGARPGDPGRGPLSGPGRPAAPGGPSGSGPAGRRDAGAPRRSSRPGAPGGRPGDPSPFETGRHGAVPPPHETTGQIRPVSGSSLPPDLHWAADDVTSTGPVSSPFSGLSSLGPSAPPPPRTDGEIAPHVAAMSPEARSAVQSTVGNAGGIAPGRGGGHGEDVAQRSRLISFLSSVR